MPAVSVRSLVKRYGGVLAVDGLSFEIPRGSITALLGGNGAGKTTTLSMLLGVLLPTAGEIRVLGVDMLKDRHAALRRMNFSSPYVDLPRSLTVRQNLNVYGRLYGVSCLEDRIAEMSAVMDLGEIIDRPVGRLSAGQQTRVSLAKALLNAPELLLLDEPTASLDPDTADRIRNDLDLYRQKQGMTILMASHNMREVERLCDNVLMMHKGRIFGQGAPRDLMSLYGQSDMEDVFLHVARNRDGGGEAA